MWCGVPPAAAPRRHFALGQPQQANPNPSLGYTAVTKDNAVCEMLESPVLLKIPTKDMRLPRPRGVIRLPLINNIAISKKDRKLLRPIL